MKRVLAAWIAVLALVNAACDQQSRVSRVPYCNVLDWSKSHSGTVRFRAHLTVGGHGAFLVHPDCPENTIVWTETEAFKNTQEHADFARREREVTFLNIPAPLGLAVDVEGRLRTQQGNRLALMVARVYAAETEPSVLANVAPAE
jgi:hypothetical protein